MLQSRGGGSDQWTDNVATRWSGTRSTKYADSGIDMESVDSRKDGAEKL